MLDRDNSNNAGNDDIEDDDEEDRGKQRSKEHAHVTDEAAVFGKQRAEREQHEHRRMHAIWKSTI